MRRKEGDKHNAILDAAIQVFSREGFAGAQVATVAEEAGVATGSVYLYFKNKDAVLDELFSRFWISVLADSETLDTSNPEAFLQEQLGVFFDHLSKDRALTSVYLHEQHRFLERKPKTGIAAYNRILLLGEQAFTRGIKAGVFSKELDVTFSRAFLFGGLRASLEYWLAHRSVSAKIIRQRMLHLAMATLSAGKRRNP